MFDDRVGVGGEGTRELLTGDSRTGGVEGPHKPGISGSPRESGLGAGVTSE